MIHSSINKIIVSGCSFTNWRRQTTWADRVQQHFDKIDFENQGRPGNSNERIVPGIIDSIIKINEPCIFIVQLTGLDRIVVNGQLSPTIGSILKSVSMNWFGMSQNEHAHSSWINYFQNEYTEEKHLNTLLTLIIELQRAAHANPNVKLKIITGWDIFTERGESSMWQHDTPYVNVNDMLLKDKYKSSMQLYDQIDTSDFWFFENDFIKYGGITQWCQYNVETPLWYNNVDNKDYHPSEHAHDKFAKDVMIPMIEKML